MHACMAAAVRQDRCSFQRTKTKRFVSFRMNGGRRFVINIISIFKRCCPGKVVVDTCLCRPGLNKRSSCSLVTEKIDGRTGKARKHIKIR